MRVPFWEALRDTVNFLGILIGANLLALIVYALVFWIPFGPFLVFWGAQRVLVGAGIFHARSDAACGAGAGQTTACAAPLQNLDGGDIDGDAVVHSACEPCDPDSRSRNVHASVSPADYPRLK